MNSHLTSLLRPLTLSVAISLLALTASARGQGADPAAQLLSRHGSIPLTAFGDYVEIGTYAIQVAVKMGAPSSRLSDGTWLYEHRLISNSNAEGTVVVRFNEGRVSSLSLATPATVARLRATPAQGAAERLAQR
jgi:hypothetical protein